MALSQNESARRAKSKIENKETFRIGDIFARVERQNRLYVVYSYGLHYPLFAYDYKTDVWYENKTKSSRATSRHRNYGKPDNIPMVESTTDDIQRILS